MTKLEATVQTNEWGIFILPDILLPDSLRQAGLAGKKVIISVQEAEE